ncbi:class I SAM-dependent methyltransferase [Abyssisolibacter fermentans]|uniref:class I SAM-dependent methyltransferase n=1 Tax=Abyssisolibacter fermentans TaxID=1766203 RepID=UPI000836AE27|nr:class I SAM-dependent methyltransferase [Abyssisolibacter fermentans]
MAVFDKEATHYDSWYKTKLGSFVDQVESDCAMSLFEVKKDSKILDIGCGTGNFSIRLAQAGAKVVAIDISDEMLSIAKQKAEDLNLDIEFYNMDVYNLKFTENTFDGVFSSAAFEFIKEPSKAMDEIFRVVKKDSSILIGTINRESEWGKLYLSDEFQKNSIFKHSCLKSKDDLRELRPENLVAIKECLFIPPYAKEDDISLEKEIELSKNESGGFLCALWKK